MGGCARRRIEILQLSYGKLLQNWNAKTKDVKNCSGLMACGDGAKWSFLHFLGISRSSTLYAVTHPKVASCATVLGPIFICQVDTDQNMLFIACKKYTQQQEKHGSWLEEHGKPFPTSQRQHTLERERQLEEST